MRPAGKHLRRAAMLLQQDRVVEFAESSLDLINFLEPLAGICYFLFRPNVPLACVANQYLFLHPDYQFPRGRMLDRI